MSETNVFLDTNILIYLFDTRDLAKHNAAKKLIADLQKISTLYIRVSQGHTPAIDKLVL